MRKEEKHRLLISWQHSLEQTPDFTLRILSGLNAENTAKLRRACYEKEIKLVVVKNTLFRKALEKKALADSELLFPVLEGPSAIMFTTLSLIHQQNL